MSSSEFERPIPVDGAPSDRSDLESHAASDERHETLPDEAEGVRWVDLSQAVENATDPSDFVHVADAYGLPQATGNQLSMGRLAGRMIERAAVLGEDRMDGSASPDEIADMTMPAMARLLEQRTRSASGSEYSVAGVLSAALLTEGIPGTAERFAALRVRDRLHEMGLMTTDDRRQAVSKRLAQRVGSADRYPTMQALRRIEEGIGPRMFRGLPTGEDALDAIQNLVASTVYEYAKRKEDTGSRIVARQIDGAFRKLAAESSGRSVYMDLNPNGVPTVPFGDVVKVANIVTSLLNKGEQLAGEQRLTQLDPRNLSDLPAAYQRILYAIDPSAVADSTSEVPIAEASEQRLSMIYVEALSGQWNDANQLPGPTLADYILWLKARKWNDTDISKHLQTIRDGRPDPMTERYQEIAQDPRTRRWHVYWRKRRRGYGAMS